MPLFSSTQPSLRARILPRFPARVLAGSGISIVKSGGTYTFSVTELPTQVIVDKGVVSSGGVVFTVSQGLKQKLTVGGPLSISFDGWPANGVYGEVEIQLVNGGSNVSWPTVNWYLGDGSSSTTFAAMGVILNSFGSNWVVVWTTDGGATLHGRAI